ncbi:hypothetical protein JCM10049v2_004775 [Rhodotorula toruloides]
MAAPAAQNAANPAPTPFEHKLVKFDLEGHFHYTFTLDLELDLSDPKLDKEFKLEGVPLVGQWICYCTNTGAQSTFALLHGELPIGIFGDRVSSELLVYWRDKSGAHRLASVPAEVKPRPPPSPEAPMSCYTGHAISILPETLEKAAKESLGRFNLQTHRSYRFVLKLHSRGLEPTPEAETLIKRMPDEPTPLFWPSSTLLTESLAELDLNATPHNVRLFFPTLEIDLWSESSILSRSSSYFKTLFASGFDENKTTRSGVHSSTSSAASRHVGAEDFKDSDSETDELFIKEHPIRQQSGGVPLAHKQVNVTSTAFTTYRAVLPYLRTGFIAFAPLSSTFPSGTSASAPTRISKVTAAVASDPSLPYPVSPKSTFRLTHLLELDDLQKLCLANLAKQLTVDCAAVELFSKTSVCYDDWRKVVLDFVADNCDAVTASSAWAEVTEKVKRDEIRGSGPIMLELFERKVPKTAHSCVAT